MEEIWKDILGYEGKYQASNLGNIKSLNYRYTGKEKILKQIYRKNGYCFVSLCFDGIIKTYSVHRLVGKTFIHNSENKPYINHKNGIRNDNRVKNLEWCTASENNLHSYRVLGHKGSMYGKFGKNNHSSKKVNQYTKELEFIKHWDCIMDVKRELGIARQDISACCRGRYKSAGGYKWQYA